MIVIKNLNKYVFIIFLFCFNLVNNNLSIVISFVLLIQEYIICKIQQILGKYCKIKYELKQYIQLYLFLFGIGRIMCSMFFLIVNENFG